MRALFWRLWNRLTRGQDVEHRLCASVTRKGLPCGEPAVHGSDYCRHHQPA
jgi:hypothetical protein